MDTPGVEVRPIRMLTGGSEFNEVFFDGARIPADNVVGAVNGGWAVAMTLLGHERGEEAALNPILFRAEFDRLVALAASTGASTTRSSVQRLAWCYERVEIMRLLGLRILTQYLRDGDLGPAASISKLYWSEYHQVAATWRWRSWAPARLVPEGHVPPRAYRTDDPGRAELDRVVGARVHVERGERHRLRGHVGGAAQHPRREHPRTAQGAVSSMSLDATLDNNSALPGV